MSILSQTIRKTFGLRRKPKNLAADYHRQGHVVHLTHSYYGPLRLLAEDESISECLLDGSGLWEPSNIELFAREFRVGRNVIDAGANLGLHSIALAKLARHGEKIFAFEPHPEIIPLTRYNCSAFPNIECIHKAASDQVTTFYMGSVLHSKNGGGTGVEEHARRGSHAVQSVTIDSLGLSNIGFMKIDVEGHEMGCIRGAAETIRRDRPTMIVEICGGKTLQTATPEIGATIRSRIDEVCRLGYTVNQVSPHDFLFRPV